MNRILRFRHRWTPNDEITWDPPARMATLDAVHPKPAVGVLPSPVVVTHPSGTVTVPGPARGVEAPRGNGKNRARAMGRS